MWTLARVLQNALWDLGSVRGSAIQPAHRMIRNAVWLHDCRSPSVGIANARDRPLEVRHRRPGSRDALGRAGRLLVGRSLVTARLLLVGGAAGTGKSTVARALAARLDGAWLQPGTLWIAMRDAAPAGSDERGRLDIDQRIRAQAEPADELLGHHITASAAVYAALPHALAFEFQTHPTVVADGPLAVARLRHPPDLGRGDIRCVFPA